MRLQRLLPAFLMDGFCSEKIPIRLHVWNLFAPSNGFVSGYTGCCGFKARSIFHSGYEIVGSCMISDGYCFIAFRRRGCRVSALLTNAPAAFHAKISSEKMISSACAFRQFLCCTQPSWSVALSGPGFCANSPSMICSNRRSAAS